MIMKSKLFSFVFALSLIVSLALAIPHAEAYASDTPESIEQTGPTVAPSEPDIPTPLYDHDWDDDGL